MKEVEEQHRASSEKAVALDRQEARKVLLARLEAIAEKYGYTYNRVAVRNQKTRWGSCSCKNNISLNVMLMLLPEKLRDFIILHELVHTRVKNHGKDFWAEMLRVEPRARKLAKEVSRFQIPWPEDC